LTASSEKKRENRVRRALAKRGCVVRKTPARSWLRRYYAPGYMIIHIRTNTVLEGARRRAYDADRDRVGWFAFEHSAA
jgi:hypothetical protein